MLRNYVKIAFRNLLRQKGYSVINVAGLALGIGCSLFLLSYVRGELNYDRYHEQADRIYRLTTEGWARMPPAMAPALMESYPQLTEQAVRFWPLFSPAKVRRGDVVFVESGGVFVDSNVLSVFSWPLVAGDSDGALAAPNAMVLTQSMAEKYFGNEDPIGASLQFWGRDMTVTGIMEDVPLNSHFRFDFLVSISSLYDVMGSGLDEDWGLPAFYTYVLARDGVASGAITEAARQILGRHRVETDSPPVLQPIRQIYLRSHLPDDPGPGGNLVYLYVLGTAAALVLLLACVNFTNLATARAAARTKEVGIRKVLGAQRAQLVRQFLGESLVMSVAALLVALLLVELTLPLFNRIVGTAIDFRYLSDPVLVFGLVILVLLVCVIAGSYPALFLSRFKPAVVLKGSGGLRMSNALFRKSLIVFQFAVSIGISIGVAVIMLQLNYIQNKDLGFDREHVLVLDGDRFPLLKDALAEVPEVESVAGAPRILGDLLPSSPYRLGGGPADSTSRMFYLSATPDFIETFDMHVVAGRSFTEGSVVDVREGFILNESAVQSLGWDQPAEAIGKPFAMLVPPFDGGAEVWREGNIIGVLQDFHYHALYQGIEPVALYPSGDLNLTFVRLERVNSDVLAAIETVWTRVNSDAPFNYNFLDEHLREKYRAELRLSGIMGAAAGVAILIACLGLFALAAYTVGQRRKEIGVRKVLGASVSQIIALLSIDFIKLVSLAAVMAMPVAYVVMRRWLENFAYNIDMSAWIFLTAGLLAFAIALLTVSYQSINAALADPVRSLRYE